MTDSCAWFYILFSVGYIYGAIKHYKRNINMGGKITGILIASIWPLPPIVELYGAYWCYKEDKDIRKNLK